MNAHLSEVWSNAKDAEIRWCNVPVTSDQCQPPGISSHASQFVILQYPQHLSESWASEVKTLNIRKLDTLVTSN